MKHLQELYNWYYNPGEVVKSDAPGFFINPYQKWDKANFFHIFAFDGAANLYVGQFSVYLEHMDTVFKLFEDKREYGYLVPKREPPGIKFSFLENRNIVYLNRRLKKICQRLLDYGMPDTTVIYAESVDLWYPTINVILGDNRLKGRPEKQQLVALLSEKSKQTAPRQVSKK